MASDDNNTDSSRRGGRRTQRESRGHGQSQRSTHSSQHAYPRRPFFSTSAAAAGGPQASDIPGLVALAGRGRGLGSQAPPPSTGEPLARESLRAERILSMADTADELRRRERSRTASTPLPGLLASPSSAARLLARQAQARRESRAASRDRRR